MQDFIYHIPTKVYFGKDQLGHLGAELAALGRRVLLVYGGGSIKRTGLYDRVIAELERAGLERFELPGVAPNPRVDSVREGARLCREHQIEVVLAVGGGSAIDAAKLICAAAFYKGDAWELSLGADFPDALPLVTVLTLAATGSEMDPGGVISNPQTNEKIGRSDPRLRPRVSFLDPTNTFTVSPLQTACGSADILSHLIETYFDSARKMDMLEGFMESMMRAVIKYAPIAMAQPDNYEARENLMWASSWAINGFTRTPLPAWSCHPMEHELSAFYDITHGLGLAILTPRWMEYCLREENLWRYVKFAENVMGAAPGLPPREAAQEGIHRLSAFLFGDLGLKSSLGAVGIDDRDFAEMAKKACKGGRINGFVPLRPADVEKIYRMCL